MARSLFVIVFLAVSAAAVAQDDFSYSYVTGSYSRADYDDFNLDGDGLGVGVSVAINESFHVFGSYTGVDLDANVDASGWQAGVGFNTPISDQMDVVVTLAYVTAEVDLPGFGTVDDDGLGLGVGLRAMVSDKIELDGDISYVDTDSGSDASLGAGFLFYATNTIAVGVSGRWDDDVSVWSLNGRIYFE